GGTPLVLIHGGAGKVSMFEPNVSALAEKRQVIGVELQGHGHTPDIDRPLSYEVMADGVAALLADLGVQQADILGYSVGGRAALQVAIRHPESVRKLVVLSAAFKRYGWYPEILAAFDQMGPATGAMMRHSPLGQTYPNVDWPGLFAKIGVLQRKEFDWSKEV